jgi:hypothetical protein
MIPKKRRTIRQIYAVFFFALFVALLLLSDYTHRKGFETSLFLELDPLTALAAFLTSENKCPVQDLPAIRVSSVGETRSASNQMILER